MSQRGSGYKRNYRDLYETPPWVTQCLIDSFSHFEPVWEPAAGNDAIVDVLKANNIAVRGTDLERGQDFLMEFADAEEDIWTNPPYNLATEFVEHALSLTKRFQQRVAMLLRTDFDHAAGRSHLFAECKAFSKKLVLRKRIVWKGMEIGPDGKKASPSFNHAWFVWDWSHDGPATLEYAA